MTKLNLQLFAAQEGVTTTASITAQAREIDFVTSFTKSIQPLLDILGISRPIKKANGTTHIPLVQQFAGYALVVSFMLKIIIGILPDFSIIALLLQFYIVYVVWEGSAILMKIAEKDRLRFTILSSMLLIACPAVIEFVFNKLTVVLN